jgi:hypothetical protein
MEKNMRKLAVIALSCALLGSTFLAAQKQPQASSKKIEALFKTAEIPFTSSEEGTYVAVITVEEGESDRFHVYVTAIGNDPNNEKLQVVQLYFLLGQLPKGTPVPVALTKQIAEWNANLTLGKVVVIETAILYTSSSWLSRTDADGLAQDAVLGHYLSKDLRKEIAPYLKP